MANRRLAELWARGRCELGSWGIPTTWSTHPLKRPVTHYSGSGPRVEQDPMDICKAGISYIHGFKLT